MRRDFRLLVMSLGFAFLTSSHESAQSSCYWLRSRHCNMLVVNTPCSSYSCYNTGNTYFDEDGNLVEVIVCNNSMGFRPADKSFNVAELWSAGAPPIVPYYPTGNSYYTDYSQPWVHCLEAQACNTSDLCSGTCDATSGWYPSYGPTFSENVSGTTCPTGS